MYEESLVFDIGSACLTEVAWFSARWWAICNHVCETFGLWELVNFLRNMNKEGMTMIGMKYDRNVSYHKRIIISESVRDYLVVVPKFMII